MHALTRITGAGLKWISLLVLFTMPAWAVERQFLQHHVPAAAMNAAPIGRTPSSTRMDLAIGLPLRNRAELTNLLAQLYDPASTNFHRYLTPQEFAQRFGPTEEDYQSVIRFAHTHGLVVIGTHPNRTLVDVRGSAGDLERTFHVKMNVYQHPTENRTFFAPNVEPSIDLATPLLAISGLDNFVVPHPCLKTLPLPAPAPAGGGKAQLTGSGPGGYYLGNDFRHAYVPGSPLTGAGQSVGLFELDGYYPADVTAYESLAGLPNVPISVVLLDNFSGSPGNGNNEVSLDIDMCISMAPGLSNVIVYEGIIGNSVLSQMATDRRANQLSASWTYAVDANTLQTFQQFGAQGQSFFNASGDSGAYSGSVAPPTDVPYITVVGGTDLTTVSGTGAWASETTWPDSSGGISATYAIPAYQQGINMTTNHGSTSARNLPDVAMIADNTFLIFDNGSESPGQGTSISSPLWAAFTALINELAVSNGEPVVGFINPAVYAIGKGSNALSYTSLFHDITTGNNENAGSPSQFLAVPGYDLCTGWGTPRGTNLIAAIALPEPLRVTPAAAIVSGPPGGPFNPAVQSFSLTNGTSGSLNWSVSNNTPWLNVTPTNGTLVFGGSATTVTASLNAESSNLTAGTYTTALAFADLTDSFVQNRPFTVAVFVPPVISAQPTNVGALIGGAANFTVGTTANALLNYQWRFNGTNLTNGGTISGSLTSNLSILDVTNGNAGNYSVTVSNVLGAVVSSNATLTIVPSAPVVTMQPSNQTVLPGQNVTFSVAAIGNTPYSYQWQFNGANLTNGVNPADGARFYGVTTSTLSISNVANDCAGVYSVIVSNSIGSGMSMGAILTVTPITAAGVSLDSLWSLTGSNGGQYIYSPLAVGSSGYLYGTALDGGPLNDGVIYRYNTNGTFSTLLAFNSNNGANPYAGFWLGHDGFYYGATSSGGAYTNGTLMRINAGGALLTLASLNGENGANPFAGMIQAVDNNYYGTTENGGAYGYGTVFRSTTSGTVTTLASFAGFDGAYPSGSLVQGTDGNFYGTTESGGANGYGTIFKITPSGTLTTLFSFDDGNAGGAPIPGLIQASDGNFYGTAIEGGIYGNGTVFSMTPTGTVTPIYSFTGGEDGANPWGALMQAADGNIYGTTQGGGTYGYGTVFRLAPSGPLVTIAQFDNYNGAYPSAPLVQGAGGILYGTTLQGGATNFGTIYKLAVNGGALQITGQPANQPVYFGGTALFTVAITGATPVSYQWQEDGTNIADGGNISGSATATLKITNVNFGDAAFFSVVVSNSTGSVTSEDATLEIIYSPPTITAQPASLTQVTGSTAVFAVTATGDQPLSCQWRQNGISLTDGGNISGSATSTLTLSSITLASAGTYTVVVSNALFEVTSVPASLVVIPAAVPGAVATTLRQLNGTTDGAWPFAGLLQGTDGNLYGTTTQGGTKFQGTVFKMSQAGAFTSLYSFPGGTSGANPYSPLIQGANGVFYGTTSAGGASGDGTIFRMTTTGTAAFLYSFEGGADGMNPYASLLQGTDGNFYGTTDEGGSDTNGSIFKMTVNNIVTPVYGFTDGTDGANPTAGLVQAPDGLYYGTALNGGSYGVGTVFSVSAAGAFSTVFSFDETNGSYPQAGLILARDGDLYGTATEGGVYGYGNVFKLTTNGVISNLFSFDVTNGANPGAQLTRGSDGAFYGTTSEGGIGGQGTVFKITTNGALTTVLWFNGFNGANPDGALIQATNGNFYGTTFLGGAGFNPSSGGGNGVVFELTVPIFINCSFSAASAISSLPYAASISNAAVTPPGDSLSFAKVSGPAWLNVAATGVISGTPANANIGTNLFAVSLTDTNGLSASATLKLVVTADPPPSFLTNPFSEPWANLGDAYSASIASNATAVTLNLGDTISFAKVSGPAWLTVATNGLLSGTPLSPNAGSNVFIVSATTLGGASTNATLNLYVNSPPYFFSPNFAKAPATPGVPYAGTVATNATDPDLGAGDTLTFYKVTGAAWLNVATNGGISGTPANTDVGADSFLVLVEDSAGLAGLATMAITVNADQPPVFAGNPFSVPHANIGVPYAASIASQVSNSVVGDTITLSKLSGPAWLSLAANGALSGTPAAANVGANSFTVQATDLGGMSSQATMLLNVADYIRLHLAANGSQFSLSWTGGTPPYQVQTTTNIVSGVWTNFGGSISSNSLNFTPANSPAYFRIQGQ